MKLKNFFVAAVALMMTNAFDAAQAAVQIKEYGKSRYSKAVNTRKRSAGKRSQSSRRVASPYRSAMGGDYLLQLDETGARWHKPIKVWVAPNQRGSLKSIVSSCFNEWQRASANAFSWRMVSNRYEANYIVDWKTAQREYRSGTEAGLTTTDMSGGWAGETIDGARTTILTKLNGRTIGDATLRGTILHEIGHGLGLMGHSPHSSDIMYYAATGQKPYLNTRDSNTIRRLYSI